MRHFFKSELISEKIRHDAIGTIYLTSLVIFFPALVISLLRSAYTGWVMAYSVQCIIFSGIAAIYLLRERLSLPFKFWVIQISLFLVAVSGLHSFGYFGSAKLLLILIPIFMWFFAGRIQAVVSTVVASLTFSLYGYLFLSGKLNFQSDPLNFMNKPASWITYGLIMLAVTIFCIVMFNKILKAHREAYKITQLNEEKFRFLAENIKDIIWVYSKEENRLTYVSPSVKHILGLTETECVNPESGILLPDYSLEVIRNHFRKMFSHDLPIPEGGYTFEFDAFHKNGTLIWLESNCFLRQNPVTGGYEIFGSSRDITDRKKVMNELRLNEANLKEKNEMLEKINSELDNFVYRISHDIKGPLSSCFGILHLMEMEKLIDGKSAEYYHMIKNVLMKQDNIIKSILDYSRNSRGELILEDIDLREMIESTFSDLKFMNDTSGKVDLTIEADNQLLHSDKNRVQFIVNNLISNAIKYADLEKEAPRILVSIESAPKGLRLKFRDNGLGIRADILPRVFEMFYRGNTNSPGSGLGLYIVKETVEKLNGNIQIESVFGEFTQFTLFLPHLGSEKSTS